MALAKILLLLDPDPQPSVFDSITALDGGVETLLRHSSVTLEQVRSLVHGAIFTRGGEQLRHTAIFVGGSDVAVGERILQEVKDSFFGNVRVSVMLDSNGANTTAAAAVNTAGLHIPLGPETIAVVLGATGPVGQRVVRMLAREQVDVRVVSRRSTHAEAVCHRIGSAVPGARLTARSTTESSLEDILSAAHLVISAGAAGVQMLPAELWQSHRTLQVLMDLNAVPPAGIEGIQSTAKAESIAGKICFGALAVGGLKMKIHKAAIRHLFELNTHVFDADEIYQIGKHLTHAK